MRTAVATVAMLSSVVKYHRRCRHLIQFLVCATTAIITNNILVQTVAGSDTLETPGAHAVTNSHDVQTVRVGRAVPFPA